MSFLLPYAFSSFQANLVFPVRCISLQPASPFSFPDACMHKKSPPLSTSRRRTIQSRVTTSLYLPLTEQTSAGTSYPAAITGGPCRSLAGFAGSVRCSEAMFRTVSPDSSQPCHMRHILPRLPAPRCFALCSGIFSGGFPDTYSLRHCFSFLVRNGSLRAAYHYHIHIFAILTYLYRFLTLNHRLMKRRANVKRLFTLPAKINPVNKPESRIRPPSPPQSLPTVPTASHRPYK